MGGAAPSPRRPCRSRGGDLPCRCARAASHAWGRGRVRQASAPPGRAGRRAKGPRSRRAACSRGGRRWPRASRRRSLPRSAGRRDKAAPCCGAHVQCGSRAWSRASDADRRHRALARRSWKLLRIAQRDTEPSPYRPLHILANGHHLPIALPLRPVEAEAGDSSVRHPALVQSRRELPAVKTPAYQRTASISLGVVKRLLLIFVQLDSEWRRDRVAAGRWFR